MRNKKNIYDDWTIDFKKILVCIIIIVLGIFYNIEEPKALAVAIVVQGISNVDNFWEYLKAKIELPLKILSVVTIILSFVAVTASIMVLADKSNLYDLGKNSHAVYYITGFTIAAAFPVILLLTDLFINLKKENATMYGGVENEPEL